MLDFCWRLVTTLTDKGVEEIHQLEGLEIVLVGSPVQSGPGSFPDGDTARDRNRLYSPDGEGGEVKIQQLVRK